jgi:hypothetical protein
MKQLHGSASASVAAPACECFTLLADIDRYPSWCRELVPNAAVVQCDDQRRPLRASATLHVSVGPLVRDFHLTLAVTTAPPELISLTRIPHASDDPEEFEVRWRLADDGNRTSIQLELSANLSVPRLLPVGGVGDSIASQLVAAASRALSG